MNIEIQRTLAFLQSKSCHDTLIQDDLQEIFWHTKFCCK